MPAKTARKAPATRAKTSSAKAAKSPSGAPKRASASKPVRAAIYARISDARGVDTAGVDRQIKDCQRLAKSQGWEVADTYVDNNVSAMSKDMRARPEGKRLLDDIESGRIDAIVAYASDRLYRRAAELEYLVDALDGVKVATVRSGHVDLSTANGRMIARMLGVVDQAESEVKGERIQRAAEERARKGKFMGGTRRLGYNKDATELVPVEAEAIREAYKIISKGGSIYSCMRLWRETIGEGAYGGKITAAQVRGVLLRPMNAGLMFYKGEEIGRTSGIPKIIDEKTWRRVKAILEDPSRRTSPGGKHRLLLTSVLECAFCGQRRISSQRRQHVLKDGTKVKRPIYRCTNDECMRVSRDKQNLDDAVVEALLQHIEAGFGSKARRKVKASSDDDSLADAMSQLQSKRAELAECEAAWEAGEMPMSTFRKVVARLNDQIKVIEGTLARPQTRRAGAEFLSVKDHRARWEKMTLEERRLVINDLIDSIVVGRGRWGYKSMDNVKINFKPAP